MLPAWRTGRAGASVRVEAVGSGLVHDGCSKRFMSRVDREAVYGTYRQAPRGLEPNAQIARPGAAWGRVVRVLRASPSARTGGGRWPPAPACAGAGSGASPPAARPR